MISFRRADFAARVASKEAICSAIVLAIFPVPFVNGGFCGDPETPGLWSSDFPAAERRPVSIDRISVIVASAFAGIVTKLSSSTSVLVNLMPPSSRRSQPSVKARKPIDTALIRPAFSSPQAVSTRSFNGPGSVTRGILASNSIPLSVGRLNLTVPTGQ